MELDRALSQISEIHAQVLRSEIFRGYRALPMAITGTIALLAAAVQASLFPLLVVSEFVLFWVGVAAACMAVCGLDLYFGVHVRDRRGFRARSLPVVLQFVPSILVGATVTAVLAQQEAAVLLPGLWACVFCLGVFASRPYLPRAVGWVALYYLFAGAFLLSSADPIGVPSPWEMGMTFGIGQFALAVVLHMNLERKTHDA